MTEEKTIQYPSTDIILDSCKIEYEKEMQRTSNIDGKTNTFLTISTALYAFFIPLSNFKQVFSLENNLKNTVSIVFLLALIIISFLTLLTATILFISVISSRAYKAINISELLPYADREKNKTSVVLCRLYDSAITYNRNLNEKRMKLFKCGVVFIIACIILTTFTYVLKVNLV